MYIEKPVINIGDVNHSRKGRIRQLYGRRRKPKYFRRHSSPPIEVGYSARIVIKRNQKGEFQCGKSIKMQKQSKKKGILTY